MSFKTQITHKKSYSINARATPQSPKGEASPHDLDCALAPPPSGGRGGERWNF